MTLLLQYATLLPKCRSQALLYNACSQALLYKARPGGSATEHGKIAFVPLAFIHYSSFTAQQQQQTAVNNNNNNKSSLRNLIKPFLLKCHPDLQTSPQTREINLQAVQNLNSYLDIVEANIKKTRTAARSNGPNMLEVDFVIQVDSPAGRKKIQNNVTRRRIELSVPSPTENTPDEMLHKAWQQIAKLLKIAGLPEPTLSPLPASSRSGGAAAAAAAQGQQYNRTGSSSTSFRPNSFVSSQFTSAYHKSRQDFMQRIDWDKFNAILRRAEERDARDRQIRETIMKNPNYKLQLVAEHLSRIRIQDDISPIDQLVAFRRLSTIMQENFTYLSLDILSHLWDNTIIILTPARDINTSSSARNKNRRRRGETSLIFTFKEDNQTMTVHVPLDFTDQEFLEEFALNLADFDEMTTEKPDDALRDIFA